MAFPFLWKFFAILWLGVALPWLAARHGPVGLRVCGVGVKGGAPKEEDARHVSQLTIWSKHIAKGPCVPRSHKKGKFSSQKMFFAWPGRVRRGRGGSVCPEHPPRLGGLHESNLCAKVARSLFSLLVGPRAVARRVATRTMPGRARGILGPPAPRVAVHAHPRPPRPSRWRGLNPPRGPRWRRNLATLQFFPEGFLGSHRPHNRGGPFGRVTVAVTKLAARA